MVLTKNGESDDLYSTHKNKGFGPQSPEDDEDDENGGCHSGKTMVYQKQGFHNPDISVAPLSFSRTSICFFEGQVKKSLFSSFRQGTITADFRPPPPTPKKFTYSCPFWQFSLGKSMRKAPKPQILVNPLLLRKMHRKII